MLEVHERLGTQCKAPVDVRVILTHEQRDRGRMRLFSTDGEEVRLFLARGTPLQVGEYLRSQCGRLVLVEGAIEPVVIASCDDWEVFSRACYHLGNRHVKLQVGCRSLRILPDHVLEEMLVLLGLTLQHAHHVFVPEQGAYTGHGGHSHSHQQPLSPATSKAGLIDALDTAGKHEHH